MATKQQYLRFQTAGTVRYGVLNGDTIEELAGNFLDTTERTGTTFALADVELLTPTVPTKVMCIGLNYKLHAEERGKKIPEEPMLFLKPTSAVVATGKRSSSRRLHKTLNSKANWPSSSANAPSS